MKPTPAQIEAAAKAINKYEKSQGTLLYDDDWFLGHAKAALTAAAKVTNEQAGADPNLVYPGKDADFVFPEE